MVLGRNEEQCGMRGSGVLAVALQVVLLALLAVGCSPEPTPDLVVAGGTVIDGTGSEGRRADVAVWNGRITAVGDVDAAGAGRVIDASGLVVAPGFVDMMGQSSLPLIADPPSAESKLRQGITTMFSGEGGLRPRRTTGPPGS